MTLVIVTAMVANLIAISLFIQGLEFYQLSRKKSFLEIWSFKNLKNDLETGLPLPNLLIQYFFSEKAFKFIIILQIIVSFVCLFYFHVGLYFFLLLSHLYICVRFRGTFNGGSDMMTFVVLTGLLITFLSPSERMQNLGLLYITVHTIYSYLKAGLVKIKQKDWRSGQALPVFLDRSLFPDIRKLSLWIEGKARLNVLLCWGVIIFEMASVVVIFSTSFSEIYFLAAFIFHFMIYLSFGLNRFFWTWLSAWPAVLYVSYLVNF